MAQNTSQVQIYAAYMGGQNTPWNICSNFSSGLSNHQMLHSSRPCVLKKWWSIDDVVGGPPYQYQHETIDMQVIQWAEAGGVSGESLVMVVLQKPRLKYQPGANLVCLAITKLIIEPSQDMLTNSLGQDNS